MSIKFTLRNVFLIFVWILFLLLNLFFFVGAIYMGASHKLDPASPVMNLIMTGMLLAIGSFCVSAFVHFTSIIFAQQVAALEATVKKITQDDIEKVKNALSDIEKKL